MYLNVYDVTRLNGITEFLGFGFYHTSIQLFGYEFSYGGHDEEQSGIVCVQEGNSAGLELKERILAGYTYYS